MRQRLARALACHLDQTQRREPAHRQLGAVAAQLLAELGQHVLAVVFAQHVDEVDDDDAAQVAQAQLARNGLRRLQVGLEDGFVEVAGAHIAARVDVDRGQRLGLVDDEVAARLELHAPRQRPLDLGVDVVQVEDGALALVVLQLFDRGRGELLAETLERIELDQRVDADALHLLVDEVAQHALGQVQLLVQQGARRGFHAVFADRRPGLAQVGDVHRQLVVAGVFGVGAQDEAARAGAAFAAVGLAQQAQHALTQLIAQLGRADFL